MLQARWETTLTCPDVAGRDLYGVVKRQAKRERWYIAGPMRGYDKYNFPAFDAAAVLMRDLGLEPLNPAQMDRDIGVTEFTTTLPPEFMEDAMRRDLHVITAADTTGIAMLPGWEASEGVRHELRTAKTCGKKVRYVDPAKGYFGERPHRLLLGLLGYAGAGKDAVASVLVDEHGFTRVAFADALKEVATAIGWDGQKGYYGRRLLQQLGLAVRDYVAEDAWVQAAEDKIADAPGPVVITDVRFRNECDLIVERGGFLARVVRPGNGPANDHVSEHALDEQPVHFTIVNDEPLERLPGLIAAAVGPVLGG